MAFDILARTQPLEPEQEPDMFGVLSLNVLMPQSQEGWWVFKAYDPKTPMSHRSWPHRQRLLEDILLGARASVVCIQEASALSFEQDFGFMKEAFDHVLHRKFRFRCATFWRRDRFEVVESHHGDRTLITALRDARGRTFFLINCHLSGGPNPDRRFRQMFDALDRVRKIAARHKIEDPGVVVCGDMNSFPGDTGLERLLAGEVIGPDYRQPGYPERVLSSKPRSHPFGPLRDLYAEAFSTERPATYIVRELRDRFHDEAGEIRPEVDDALDAMFDACADGAHLLGPEEVERWITDINLEAARGTEWHMALELMEESGSLSREQFRAIYHSRIQGRWLWAVQHDLAQFELDLPARQTTPCAVCIDRIYASSRFEGKAVRETLTDEQHHEVYARGDTLPNAWHPSDHLPVAARLAWSE